MAVSASEVAAGVAAGAAVPPFDDRGWTVGNQQKNARQSLTEYVLPGQTVDSWRELVTSTVFVQPIPIAAFLQRLRASLSQGCPSLVWNVLQQDERTAVFASSGRTPAVAASSPSRSWIG